jgi:hypothetical protein
MIAERSCPSRIELAARDADGTLQAIDEHVRGCARCRTMLSELVEARAELLGPDPATAALQAARRISALAADRRAEARRRWTFWLPVGLAPAAAALALVLSMSSGSGSKEDPLAHAPRDPLSAEAIEGVRIKGDLAIRVHNKRGDQIFEVENGAQVRAGDRLRFSYTHPRAGFIMVFGVDDQGAVFPYYQDGSLQSMPAVAGAQVMLPGSVEMDDHEGLERVFVLWSVAPLDADAVRAAVLRSFAVAGGVRGMERLSVGDDQATVLLERP